MNDINNSLYIKPGGRYRPSTRVKEGVYNEDAYNLFRHFFGCTIRLNLVKSSWDHFGHFQNAKYRWDVKRRHDI